MSTSVLVLFQPTAARMADSGDISNILTVQARWGGWGSNPRPADYEKYGLMHHAP